MIRKDYRNLSEIASYSKLARESKAPPTPQPPPPPTPRRNRVNSGANYSEESCLDVSARSFWQINNAHFFMSGCFNSFARSHYDWKRDTAFTSNENKKKCHYNEKLLMSYDYKTIPN